MSRSLGNRINKVTERLGDPNNARARAEAIARGLSTEQLNAEIRRIMLAGGYDPNLPHCDALAAYIEKMEAEADTNTPEEQEIERELVALQRNNAHTLTQIFP